MIKTRNGMFETNSSSTHTIIVTDKNVGDVSGLSVDFAIGEFGWKCRKLSTPDQKASYLYTMACQCLERDVYQDLYKILTKYGVYCTCSGPADFGKYGLDNGYIDHGYNCPEFFQTMLAHEHILLRYLFSEQSFIVTGNDNMYEEENPFYETLQSVNYPHTEFYKGN